MHHINKPEEKDRLFAMGFDIVGASLREPMAMVKPQMDRLGKVIKEAGLKAR